MALPTKDEIRERATDIYMARLPPEERAAVPTPEEDELKETGIWYEAQRELMTGERKRIEEELERWEELAEPEKVELRERIEIFDLTLDRLSREWEEFRKKVPEVKVEVRPRRFSVGDTVKKDEREGTVKDFRWDKKEKRWEYLVSFGPGEEWIPEEELTYIWRAPPEEKPPEKRPPPRPPRAPPKPLEFVCPRCGRPLMRVDEIWWTERVPVMEALEPGMPEVPTGEYTEVVQTRKIPPAELIFMCVAGEGDRFRTYRNAIRRATEEYEKAVETERRVGFKETWAREEVERARRDLNALVKEFTEWEAKAREKCPYFGMYFRVRDGKLLGPTPHSTILRQVMPPRRPTPRPAYRAPRRMWPFRGPPTLPVIRPGMSDEEIKKVYAERGITLTDEGVRHIKERLGV